MDECSRIVLHLCCLIWSEELPQPAAVIAKVSHWLPQWDWGKVGMKLMKRWTGSGYMRRARQLQFAVRSLESGKKEEENKCIWLPWVTMPNECVEKVKYKEKKKLLEMPCNMNDRKAFSVWTLSLVYISTSIHLFPLSTMPYTLYFIFCPFSAPGLQCDPINSVHTDAVKLLWAVCNIFFLINGINEKMHLDSSSGVSALQGNFTA